MKDIQIIYEHGQPHGIRDDGGFLFFFTKIRKYQGQEERYREEIEDRYKLADFLKKALEQPPIYVDGIMPKFEDVVKLLHSGEERIMTNPYRRDGAKEMYDLIKSRLTGETKNEDK